MHRAVATTTAGLQTLTLSGLALIPYNTCLKHRSHASGNHAWPRLAGFLPEQFHPVVYFQAATEVVRAGHLRPRRGPIGWWINQLVGSTLISAVNVQPADCPRGQNAGSAAGVLRCHPGVPGYPSTQRRSSLGQSCDAFAPPRGPAFVHTVAVAQHCLHDVTRRRTRGEELDGALAVEPPWNLRFGPGSQHRLSR
jgi:hypothetical protein